MRALVTGDAGFLGRGFVRELTAREWTVCGADIVNGKDAFDVFSGNLYDGIRWDLVVHCAAVAPHRMAIDNMPGHYTRNLRLDSSMFEWAVRTRQQRVIYLSSSAAYPIGYQLGPTEDKPGHRLREYDATPGPVRASLIAREGPAGYALIQPDAGYGRLKQDGERMAAEACASGITVSTLRPFSGYGGTQGIDWPFGAFIDRAKRGADPFEVWGDGAQVRDWVHVSDVVNAALAVSDAEHVDPVNICTGVGTSMAELARMVCDEAGYEPEFEFRFDRPVGVAYRVGDPTELHRFYTPRVALDEGIRWALK